MTSEPETIGQHLQYWAKARPEQTALISPKRIPLTYRDYGRQADYVGEFLTSIGISPGHRVAIILPTGPEAAVCYASICSHATAAPLKPSYTVEELRTYMKRLSINAVITGGDDADTAKKAAAYLDLPVIGLSPEIAGPAGTFRLTSERPHNVRLKAPDEAGDLALVVMTSATTSAPKIIPLTHRNILARAKKENAWFGITGDDRVLCLNPLYNHSGLKMAVVEPLISGGSTIMLPDFDPANFLSLLQNYQPTWCTGAATFFHDIARMATRRDHDFQRHSLLFIRSGSTRLQKSAADTIEEAFGVPLINAYSSSEAGMMTANPLPPAPRDSTTVGLAIDDDVCLLGDDGSPVAPEMTGEIAARGATVMRGYEAAPEINAAAFSNGWFRTGDMGRFNKNGFLVLTGRRTEMINRGGEKISPDEIDAVLQNHPSVKEAASFGLPHPTLNELVVAAIVPADGVPFNPDALKRHSQTLLAPTKVPRKFFVVDQLPRNSNRKLQRRKLLDLVS